MTAIGKYRLLKAKNRGWVTNRFVLDFNGPTHSAEPYYPKRDEIRFVSMGPVTRDGDYYSSSPLGRDHFYYDYDDGTKISKQVYYNPLFNGRQQ